MDSHKRKHNIRVHTYLQQSTLFTYFGNGKCTYVCTYAYVCTDGCTQYIALFNTLIKEYYDPYEYYVWKTNEITEHFPPCNNCYDFRVNKYCFIKLCAWVVNSF